MKRDSHSPAMRAALAAYARREGESVSAAIARVAVAQGVSAAGLYRALLRAGRISTQAMAPAQSGT